ncbi:MAG: type I-F CRISPR-associated protein Csy3 [Formosimonas sp.]
MATKNSNAIASVLAFEKKLVASDGFLYGTTWAERSTKAQPLKLIEKSVRGTISNRLKPAIANDPLKLNAEVEKANLQRVDACALDEHQDTLKLRFTLKVLGNIEKPSACNNNLFKASYEKAAQAYVKETGFKELAKRYALNIANGRSLWRNRVGAEKVETVVTVGEQSWTFNAFDFSLKHFDDTSADIEALADKIAQALSGQLPYLLLTVDVYALVGNAQEVYPSEELVLDKGNDKNKKSKILYAVNEVAAMHSQKIGNALRTIDTWYPQFDDVENSVGPIAIEVYGAVTNLGQAFRNPKTKSDFYTLFDQFALGGILNDNDRHYVMGVLVRGGVFGKSEKDAS